jgi:hypothetical protein
MTAKILPLPGLQAPRQPLAHYVRLGHTGYRQLETLHGKGRFPAQRVVVDACRFKFQKELISALRASGSEIILDTNAAELSALSRFEGVVRFAPWASIADGSPLRPAHFDRQHSGDILGQIARFAVLHQVDAVLAPGHFLQQGFRDEWFEADRESCVALRGALDREGGKQIGIDYLLLPTYTQLHDEAVRGAFLAGLADLPFTNLWIRASGFGADGTPLGARRFITALFGLHNLGKPVIADHVGGLIGLATVAFGASSGIAHGVGEHERFNASSWDKPRKKSDDQEGGGPQVRVAIPALDRSATVAELQILAKARGGHRLVVCGDRNCCPHGFDDMTKNWRAHFIYQRFRQTRTLEDVPDQNRVRHFLDNDMAEADRIARQVKELKINDRELTDRLIKHSRRVEAMRSVLDSLAEARRHSMTRAQVAAHRITRGHGRSGA